MFAEIQDSTVNKIDPTDTDGDGLTDFQETGIVYNVDRRYIGYGEYKSVKYFVLRSDPTKPDTDEDGIGDKDDPKPWVAEYIITKLTNRYKGVDYLRVEESEGVYKNGGDQEWWMELASSQKSLNYSDYRKDRAYGMWRLGCGVTAMTNLELYLTQQNTGYSAPSNPISYDWGTGVIKKEDYMGYAEKTGMMSTHCMDFPG